MTLELFNTRELALGPDRATVDMQAIVAQGERGEQGLPGNASAAWTASTAVTTGTVRQAPDGSWIKSTASRTTRATFDSTEQGFWAATLATAGTLEASALSATYAGTLAAFKQAVLGTAFRFTTAPTYDSNGVATSGAIEWPDGGTGTYTVTSQDSAGAVTGFTASTTGGPIGTKTATVTIPRDSSSLINGAMTLVVA